MIDLLIKRGKALRHRQRTCKDGGREGSDADTSRMLAKIFRSWEGGKDPYLRPSGGEFGASLTPEQTFSF